MRGIHFQYPPFAENKLIRVIQGKVLFTLVDLRLGSKTFGQWIQITVSAKKKNMIYVAQGIGNCMCALTNNCQILYKIDNYYSPENSDIIKWNDPDLAIKFPIKIPTEISERDNSAQSFKEFVEKHKGINSR